jgi:hypothetical protein
MHKRKKIAYEKMHGQRKMQLNAEKQKYIRQNRYSSIQHTIGEGEHIDTLTVEQFKR